MSFDWSTIASLFTSWGIFLPLAIFFMSLLLVPIMLISLPENYFLESKRQTNKPRGYTTLHMLLVLPKNIIGVTLILVGVVMLVLPGQGVLTILAGLMLTNFPGKYRLEKWLVHHSVIRKSINWIRMRANRAPMIFD